MGTEASTLSEKATHPKPCKATPPPNPFQYLMDNQISNLREPAPSPKHCKATPPPTPGKFLDLPYELRSQVYDPFKFPEPKIERKVWAASPPSPPSDTMDIEDVEPIVLQSSKPGKSFLDLPPELRNKVYKTVFEKQSDTIAIHLDLSDEPNCNSLACEIIKNSRPKDPRIKADHLYPLGILSANRQIRDETIGVFYGSNTFEFLTSWDAVVFLNTIGETAANSIRSLKIGKPYILKAKSMPGHFDPQSIAELSQALLRLPQLRSLEIAHTAICSVSGDNVSGRQLALAFEPVIRSLFPKYEAADLNVLDVVKIYGKARCQDCVDMNRGRTQQQGYVPGKQLFLNTPHCRACNTCPCWQGEQENAEFEMEFKQTVMEYLQIGENGKQLEEEVLDEDMSDEDTSDVEMSDEETVGEDGVGDEMSDVKEIE